MKVYKRIGYFAPFERSMKQGEAMDDRGRRILAAGCLSILARNAAQMNATDWIGLVAEEGYIDDEFGHRAYRIVMEMAVPE